MTNTKEPSVDLRRLDRLVGTWQVTGGANGTVRFEWLEGGFFLMQRFDFVHGDHRVKGIELIGHLQSYNAPRSEDVRSRIYDSEGNTFEYTYALVGDTLTIWSGERGSSAYYQGTFSADGNTCTGGWVFPGGGGYSTVMTRLEA